MKNDKTWLILVIVGIVAFIVIQKGLISFGPFTIGPYPSDIYSGIKTLQDNYPVTILDINGDKPSAIYPQCPLLNPDVHINGCKYPPGFGTPSGLECMDFCYYFPEYSQEDYDYCIAHPSIPLLDCLDQRPVDYEYSLLTKTYQCYSDTECGTSRYVGQPYCSGGNVYQQYETIGCSHLSFTCTTSTSEKPLESCSSGCEDGKCIITIDPSCTTIGAIAQFDGEYYICKDNKWIGVSYLLSIDNDLLNAINATLQEKLKIIENYTSELELQLQLIAELQVTTQEKAIIISQLYDEISIQKQAIEYLSANLEEKIIYANLLEANNAEQARLLEEFRASLAQEQEYVSHLQGIVAQDAIYIDSLNLSLKEEAQLIADYNYTLEQQDLLMKELNQSLAREVALNMELQGKNLELLNKLKELEDQIKGIGKFDWEKYKWPIIVIGGSLLVILFIKKRKW
jgi:hypothetical protein